METQAVYFNTWSIGTQLRDLLARCKRKLSLNYISGWLGWHGAGIFMRLTGMTVMRSRLRAIDKTLGIDYGWIGFKCVTAVGAIALMREWYDGPNVMKNFKYQATGLSSQVESSSDTALISEVETRDSSSIFLLGAGNALSVVASHTYTSIYSLREHMVCNTSSGATSVFDRTVFSTITVGVGTVVEWNYEITAGLGG